MPTVRIIHRLLERLLLFVTLASALWLGSATVAVAAEQRPAETNLIGHWKLDGDCQDSSGRGHHAVARDIQFGDGPDGAPRSAAVFNGRSGVVEVPHSESLRLGKDDFSVSVWVKPESPMRSVFGDIMSKFDPAKRRGLNFHLAGSSSGYQSMCDTRHVHFGIDDAYLSDWEDCGKPCPSNSLITALVVFEGNLYAGIGDAEDPQDACRTFRWSPDTRTWVDCGRLGDDPNHRSVMSLIVHDGKLYAGTGMWDWEQGAGLRADQGKPPASKPRVFVYEGGTKWRDLGQVGETSRVLCMASFNGELYVGLDKLGRRGKSTLPGKCYKYDGKKWIDCGAPDGRNMENLLPLGGRLYGATHGNIYRYEGEQNWTCIGYEPHQITQIHSLDVYRGRLHAGTWRQGYVLRHEGDDRWSITGLLGLPRVEGERELNEINDLIVHNGKLYAGVIPKSEVYRYEKDGNWTLLKQLGRQPTFDRNTPRTWCRVTAIASYQGKMFAGTGSCYGSTDYCDPDGTLGRISSIQAGQVVSHEHDIGGGWTHLTAVRRGPELRLYVNGRLVAKSLAPEGRVFDLSNTEPLVIGFGAQTHFTGSMADVRLYGNALADSEIRQLATRPSVAQRGGQ